MTCSDCQKLRDRVEELEALLGQNTIIHRGFTKTEANVLGAIISREQISFESLITIIYGGDNRLINPLNVIRVIVRRLRKKGVVIDTIWGFGYSISKAEKERINATYK